MMINKENYYSLEASRETYSVSQYKRWLQCENETLAWLRGEVEDKFNEAFLIGQLVHAYSEGTLSNLVKENYKEIISSRGATKGQVKAAYKVVDKMIMTIENDNTCKKFLDGEKEVIIEGELFGVKWRGMVDVLNLEKGFFSDIKTTQNIHKRYNGLTFIEHYGYIEQMAIYRELIKQQYCKDLIPYIVAVEKNDTPDKAIIKIDERYTNPKLLEIEYNIERIDKVKNGILEPVACGECDYCKATKRINKILNIEDL